MRREIHTQRIDKFQQFFTDLRRIVNSIAIYEGYIGENPSQERFLEVITRFEVEVFGHSKVKGSHGCLRSYWYAQKSAGCL